MNEFKDKVIVFDGDSICHGGSEQNGDACGWAYRVGTALEMEWYNYAVGGATVTTDLYSSRTGNPRHWISSYIDVIRNKHEKLDYLIRQQQSYRKEYARSTPLRQLRKIFEG